MSRTAITNRIPIVLATVGSVVGRFVEQLSQLLRDAYRSRSGEQLGTIVLQFPTEVRNLSWCCVVGLPFFCAASSFADDVVFLKPRVGARDGTRVTGTITDYTGRELLIRTVGDREQSIPAQRIDDVATTLTERHAEADRLFDDHQYSDAEALYRRALADEPRQWVRRMILAQVVRCLRHQNKNEQAASTFLLIVQNDPSTQYFDAIPLVWRSTELPLAAERRATQWLRDERDPVARLIAASWLLSGPPELREEAKRTLETLTRGTHRRVAQLAEVQRWRTQIVTADREIARRQAIVADIEPFLRAGAYHLLGQALLRQRHYQQAALALMRVPILYPGESGLAAESLLAAAEALEKNEQMDEARICLRELLRDHPGSTAAAAAKSKLEQTATGG